MKLKAKLNCCNKRNLIKSFEYIKRPELETDFNIKNYHRFYKKCKNCGHYFSFLNFNINKIYKKEYSQKTYGNLLKIEKTFNRIVNLPKSKSDNKNRILRCAKFIKGKNILDIGSGMGVFPYELKKKVKKLQINLLEKDKNLVKFLQKNFKKNNIKTNIDYFFKKRSYNNFFDFISINKVLEHIENPMIILGKLKKILKFRGILYIEVPDCKASLEGQFREEFFIEHLHVFSIKSLKNMIKKIKLKVIKIKGIKEKSGKYTLFVFCRKY